MPPLSKFNQNILAVAIGHALCGAASHAATINVDNDCSLVEAINSANSQTNTPDGLCETPGADDVILLPDENLVYTSGIVGVYAAAALPDISSPITLQGHAGGGSVVSRSNAALDNFRIVSVAEEGDLTVSNVTLQNGVADNGGAIYVYGGNLTLDGSTISGNTAAESGGGLYASEYATINVQNQSRFENNHAADGAAISVENVYLSIASSSIVSNTATASHGGIAANLPAFFQLDQSTISQNTAATFAGGLGLTGNDAGLPSATISNSSISLNQANGVDNGLGGGVYIYGLDAQITNTQISSNFARNGGGGVYVKGDYSLLMSGGSLTDNTTGVTGGGGGICLGYSLQATLSGVTINGNAASEGGGVLSNNQAGLVLERSTVSNNTASDSGGGVFHSGAALDVNISTISGNSAVNKGAGIALSTAGNLTASTIVNNLNTSAVYAAITPVIRSTVIAGGNSANCDFPNPSMGQNNWFQDNSCDGVADGDPRLGVLRDNNQNLPGTTLTHLPRSGSPLLGNGLTAICTDPEFALDQRGAPREACDIGAVEAAVSDTCFVIKASSGNVITFCL